MPQQPAAKLRKGGNGKASRPPPQCFLCHKTGHLARDCPERGTGGTQTKRAFGASSFAFGCCEGHLGGDGKTLLTTDCPAGPTGGEQWSHAFGAHDYDQLLLQGYDDYAPDYFSEPDDLEPVVLGASSWINHHYGILDGGATSSCASYEIVQSIADSWEPLEQYPECEAKDKSFVFGGGEQSQSKTRAWLPNDLP